LKPPELVVGILAKLAKIIPTWSIAPTKDIIDLAYKSAKKRQEVFWN
jgi:hypothetical protein